jgi:Domain of unknown function (DUF5916)
LTATRPRARPRALLARSLACAAACLVLPPAAATAQGPDTLYVRRLPRPLAFDGMPDEEAWDAIPPLPLTVFSPVFGAPPTERTEIRIAYDDRYLYVSGRLYDSDPSGIRVNTLYRDQYSGDDVLGVVLDTYADHQSASWFEINPAGVRTDQALSHDAEFSQGDPRNPDWNTFWDAATRRTRAGWFAELRIPFSSLAFQGAHGRVVMGMSVYRVIARRNERQLFPAIPPSYGQLAFAKPSQLAPIVLQGVHRHEPVYVTPYVLGGSSRAFDLDTAQAVYQRHATVPHEAGLDVRVSPTSNLTLDFTSNTDFAQVEADDQQVNLTRFSLFFPEKRQFFQERSAVFDFNLGDEDLLFHSRRIGLVNGRPIRVLGGTRLVGRVGGLDIGFVDMETGRHDSLPAENLGVLRLRQRVLNANSTVGAMLTSRLAAGGRYNLAGGLDAVVRTVGDNYVTLKWAQTFDDSLPGTRLGQLASSSLLARFERRNLHGFSYVEELTRSGAAYLPRLGFNLRGDVAKLETHLRYGWFGSGTAPFQSLTLTGSSKVFLRNGDGGTQSAYVEPSADVVLRSGREVSLTLSDNYESVTDTFDLSGGTPVPPGQYWFRQAQLQATAPAAARFRPTFGLTVGQFYDGTLVALSASPAWNPSSHLELGADYQFNRIRFPARGRATDLHLLRLRIATAYDAHLSLSTFWQYNNAAHTATVNARLRYNFREGSDLWIVYNDAASTDRLTLDPVPPADLRRALLVKYTYTLTR